MTLILLLLVAFAAAILIWRSPAPPPKIMGTLSREDLVQIRKVVRNDMWQQAFPMVSWQTLKQSPRSLAQLITSRMVEIEVLAYTSVQVHVKSRFGDRFYLINQHRNDRGWWEWTIRKQGPTPPVAVFRAYHGPSWFGQHKFSGSTGGLPAAPGAESAIINRVPPTESEFSAWLSNRAKLTFDH